MFEKIKRNITERLKNQPNSLAASDDEVSIAWLVTRIDELELEMSQLDGEIQDLEQEIGDMQDVFDNLPVDFEELR